MIKFFNKSVYQKIIAGVFCTLLSASFATVSINADVDARLRAKINDGRKNVTNFYDTGKIKIGTTVDNVTATLALSRKSSQGTNFLTIDSFSLQVQDLFSGLLHLQFFNWNLEETPMNGDSDVELLSDIEYVGGYFKINPVDIFSFGFGYGAAGFMDSSVMTSESDTVSHGIKSNFSFGGPVPVDLFVGTTLVQGYSLDMVTPATEASTTSEGETIEATEEVVEKGTIKFGLDRVQAGLSVKLYKSWANVYLGTTLPVGGAVTYLKSPSDAAAQRGFIYAVGIDGEVPILDTGLTIAYYFFYAGDNFAKSLPNKFQSQLTGIDDYSIKMNVSPSYSLGIIKFTLGLDVFMEEKWTTVNPDDITFDLKSARDNLMKARVLGDFIKGNPTKADFAQYIYSSTKRNPLGIGVEPKISLMFAPGISVDFLYHLGVKDLTDKPEGGKTSLTHAVGMNVKATFGYTTE